MPWNMIFQGNYSIHGWPYYPDGTETPRSFSSGCINLSSEDAKAVFEAAPTGTALLVLEYDFKNDAFSYESEKAPENPPNAPKGEKVGSKPPWKKGFPNWEPTGENGEKGVVGKKP